MHSITVIEILFSSVFIISLFIIAILMPKRFKKMGLYIASLVTVFLLIFFAVRPFVHDYQFSKKKEYLNAYLMEKFPNEKWEITKQEGRQYNRNYLRVTFEDENDWTYLYIIKDRKKICQEGYILPEDEFSKKGKHLESNVCK